MWRAFSLALGITLLVVGAELFLVEEVEVRKFWGSAEPAPTASQGLFQTASWNGPSVENAQPKTILYRPADWMPWSFLAAGTIITLYTFTLTPRPPG